MPRIETLVPTVSGPSLVLAGGGLWREVAQLSSCYALTADSGLGPVTVFLDISQSAALVDAINSILKNGARGVDPAMVRTAGNREGSILARFASADRVSLHVSLHVSGRDRFAVVHLDRAGAEMLVATCCDLSEHL
jgi:hypothetical protein